MRLLRVLLLGMCVSMTGCAMFGTEQTGTAGLPEKVNPDEAWMEKCPSVLPELKGNTGEAALDAAVEAAQVYFKCATNHNSLVDFERKR